MADVAIARCAGYDGVEDALMRALDGVGGLDWVVPGMNIALKVNLVSAGRPESAVATHPALVCALTRMLVRRGARVRVGDSPGGLYTALYVGRIYTATGMRAVEGAGGALNQDFSQREAEFPQGRVLRAFQYTAWLDWADVVMDVCKLKTHGMMGMSCAAKNLFGVVPGTLKPEYHFLHSDPRDFADMIVDLNEFVRPRLSICDAVVSMEGNGPTAGRPRFVGAVLAAHSPHALDLVCAHIIGLKPDEVPTLFAARERGYIPRDASDLEIAGELFCVPDYAKVAKAHSLQFHQPFKGPLGALAGRVVRAAMGALPAVCRGECVGCAKCARVCPAHAIQMCGRLPRIDRRACIRCFCCQEFCPEGAMKVRRPRVARLLGGGGAVVRKAGVSGRRFFARLSK